MESFQHLAPPLRLFQGEDSLAMLPRELDRLGCRRAVVFCGQTVGRGFALALVQGSLAERCAGVFHDVQAHSPLAAVEAGAQALRRHEADAVVAIGGGSAIVTARAASIVLAERRPVEELSTRRGPGGKFESPRLAAPKLPQFAVLTTPTTASVKAGSAVFDAGTRRRLALFDPKTRAQAIFIHPRMALSSPPHLALTASLNTLAMAVEGLESALGNPLSDGMLMHALRLLRKALPELRPRPEDPTLRVELMLAAILCGQGTDHAGGGIASVLAHALGARHASENGLLQGILLPHTMRFNAPATVQRIDKVVEAFGSGGRGADAAIERVTELLATTPAPSGLRHAGVPRDALDAVAQDAMNDWFVQRNPRAVTEADLLEVLRAAW